MNVERLVFASFLSAFTAVGCAAAPSSAGSEPTAETEDAVHGACANVQSASLATPAEKTARYQKFLARNAGESWHVAPPSWAGADLDGSVEFSYRTDAVGGAVAVTAAQAEESGRAFVLKNWDILGFRSEHGVEHAKVTATAVSGDYLGGGYAFRVLLEAKETQAGYEHIEGASQELNFVLDVAVDGLVRHFTSVDTNRLPTLTLSPTPTLPVGGLLGGVIGQELAYTPGPYESDSGTTFHFGAVTAEDIVATELLVYADHAGHVPGTTWIPIRMAHVVRVERPGARATFTIDTCTGEVSGPSVDRLP